jgi:hypothetical protein
MIPRLGNPQNGILDPPPNARIRRDRLGEGERDRVHSSGDFTPRARMWSLASSLSRLLLS